MSIPAQGGTAEIYLFGGNVAKLLVKGEETGGAFCLVESLAPPGNATPPHVHDREDETAYVISGVLTVETGGQVLQFTAGQAKLLKRGIPHRLSNRGESDVRFLIYATPAGFDDFVREAGERVEGALPSPRPMTEAERAGLAGAMTRHGIHLADEKAL